MIGLISPQRLAKILLRAYRLRFNDPSATAVPFYAAKRILVGAYGELGATMLSVLVGEGYILFTAADM